MVLLRCWGAYFCNVDAQTIKLIRACLLSVSKTVFCYEKYEEQGKIKNTLGS